MAPFHMDPKPRVIIVNMPQEFSGTPEEVAANRNTHLFDWHFMRCMDCDCRPWGRVAQWPCGADVPRVDVAVEQQ